MVRSVGFAVAWARAQGFGTALGAMSASVVLGCVLGAVSLSLPGISQPFPVVRVFPTVIATCGATILAEPWQWQEMTGARSPRFLRTIRFVLALGVVGVGGCLVGISARSTTLLLLALAVLVLQTAAIGCVGPYWWLVTAPGLYGQLFASDVETLRPPVVWLLVAVVAAGGLYRRRGERLVGPRLGRDISYLGRYPGVRVPPSMRGRRDVT